jgi:hypothetical protein
MMRPAGGNLKYPIPIGVREHRIGLRPRLFGTRKIEYTVTVRSLRSLVAALRQARD